MATTTTAASPPSRSRDVRSDDGRELEVLQYIFNRPDVDDELRGHPDKILAAIDTYSNAQKRLMNIGPTKGELICELIAERKPSVMVELGGYVGYSAIKFGDAVRRAGGQRYLSLEINPVFAAVSNMMVELAGLRDIVQIVVGPAHISLPKLLRAGVFPDDTLELLFLDHFKDRYLPDLWLVERLRLLKPGVSMLVADNIGREASLRYLDWLQTNRTERAARVNTHPLAAQLHGVDLQKLVRETGEKATGFDLANVPGTADLTYETVVHQFQRRSEAGQDGVAVTKVLDRE